LPLRINPCRAGEANARGAFALTLLVSSLAPIVASCGSSGQAAARPPAAGAPVTVVMAVLQPKPVDRTSEYVATLRSRQTSAISPQVEGIVTRILVRSGQRVAAGAALAQVDPLKQEASVSSNEATRAAQEAQLRLAREELQRQKALFEQGLVSRQVLDQANTAADTAAASLTALQARERESRVELQYYRVTAPAAGVVGDIPVHVGDRVTTSTVITTISDNAGLEAYIYVPIERAQDLKLGMPVRLVSAQGEVLAATRVDFVSPAVDDRTQGVLAKAQVPSDKGFRTEQFARVQIVWSSDPGLTVPVVAVTRINGQYFAYVAERGEKGGFIARQRLVRLRPLTGAEYLIENGLKPGERLIVSGIQKIADGVPVAPAS
jgi:RND family efflux transporter MFP subunit